MPSFRFVSYLMLPKRNILSVHNVNISNSSLHTITAQIVVLVQVFFGGQPFSEYNSVMLAKTKERWSLLDDFQPGSDGLSREISCFPYNSQISWHYSAVPINRASFCLSAYSLAQSACSLVPSASESVTPDDGLTLNLMICECFCFVDE